MKKIIIYESLEDDIIESKNQSYKLKDNYKWIKKNIFYILLSYLVYYIVLIIAFIYCKLILKVQYKNRKILREKGYFIYSNHTLAQGDVLNPFLINFPRRPYIICSASNFGIPVIGKLLSLGGALPIPNELSKYKDFVSAVEERSKKHPIVIYPEAHIWPYYTKIRPFNKNSFHYPVEMNKSCYTATTTYQNGKIIINIDGKFNKKEDLTRKENIKYLYDEVFKSLEKSSSLSNTEKYIYKEKKDVTLP